MKKIYALIFCVIIFSFILIQHIYAQQKPRIFDQIEFKGVSQLSKAEIASKAGIMMQDRRFIVDMDRLEGYLVKESMIKQYKLIDKKNVLTILVSEQESVQTVAVIQKDRTLLCEVDDQGRIIAAGRAYKKEGPLLIIRGDDFSGNRFSPRAMHVMTLMIKNAALWRQAGSVELRSDGHLDILMNGRPTVFTMSADAENIPLLEAALAQLDRGKVYPPAVEVRKGFAVLRGIAVQ